MVGSTVGDPGGPRENFVTDLPAAHYASMFRRDGLTGGHVIMLGPGNEGEALSALTAWPGGMQLGGGVGPGNAAAFLEAGASHVIVTSYVFPDGRPDMGRLREMGRIAGKGRLVIDLSCAAVGGEYVVAMGGWSRLTETVLDAGLMGALAEHCDEFLIHAVDKEGKRGGVDAGLIALCAEGSPIPVTYAGGVRDMGDIEAIMAHGKGRVDYTVGSALDVFGGSLPYAALAVMGKGPIGPRDGGGRD